ncbi:hypothetical protein EsH8_XII_000071 [Colletotrichum jinshuiense]
MKFGIARLLASAALIGLTRSIVVTPGVPAGGLESAGVKDSRFIFSGHPVFSPNPNAIGTFTNGPPGLTSGIIMSTGLVANAVVGSTPDTNFGYTQNRSPRLCGTGGTSMENLYYGMFITIPQDVTSVRINYLFATQEAITGNPDSAVIYRNDAVQAQTAVTAQSQLAKTGADFGLSIYNKLSLKFGLKLDLKLYGQVNRNNPDLKLYYYNFA